LAATKHGLLSDSPKAVEARYLRRLSPGYTNRTAEYGRSWPEQESVQQSGKQSPGDVTARPDALPIRRAVTSPAEVDTALLDATTRADLSAVGTDRDVGSDEEQPCQWHRFAPCPEDCANHPDNRRRTA
jgi:hypothetical protein